MLVEMMQSLLRLPQGLRKASAEIVGDNWFNCWNSRDLLGRVR